MFVTAAPLWYAQTNCYLAGSERSGEAIVVDAPPDPEGVGSLLARHGMAPVALLITHGHIDHVGGARRVVQKFAVSAYLHPDDEWLARDPASQIRNLMGFAAPAGEYEAPDRFTLLADGDTLHLAGLGVQVLHTPGHTPGHCCFQVPAEGVLFSGDQLFAGSIGRTDLPGGDYATLMRSMEEKVLPLADDTSVLPGHGPATTLGSERRSNPFLQELLR